MMDDAKEGRFRVPVPPGEGGGRLDRVLARALPHLSRTRLKSLILGGAVNAGAETLTDPSKRVKPGEVFEVRVPAPRPPVPLGEAIDLDIAFEDDHLIVIEKPAGMVVHPAPGNPGHTLVNALIHHCGDSLSGIGGVARPGIVHRLDKDTSGLMVAAKNDAAHQALARQFAAHSLERAYLAVAWGVPRRRQGEIAGNIGRNPGNRKKMALLARGGRPSLTRYKVVKVLAGDGAKAAASLIECRLSTGRTHQIRVHLASLGHPVVGDGLYGGRQARGKAAERRGIQGFLSTFGRHALHAYLIGFDHPVTQKRLRFERDLPNEINELMEILASSSVRI